VKSSITILCIIFSSLLLTAINPASAQWYKIKGTVYDSSRNYPLPSVSVLSTSGKGTMTNANGDYEIEVMEKDSIWFSYLNKPTIKFPVLKINNPFGFDIALQVNVPVLKEVKVRPRDYKFDSLQNRQAYEKIFNYKKGLQLKSITPQYGAAAGFDLNEIINAFRFKRNRQLLSFQRRLIMEEQEKSIDHRFSKALVRRLTGLSGNELDSFMVIYRPPYYFTQLTSDYDFQKYIKDSYSRFKKGLPPLPLLRPDEEEEQ
jgi:hypothetical protein